MYSKFSFLKVTIFPMSNTISKIQRLLIVTEEQKIHL